MRLAERQGLLKGRRLSRVQQFALELLIITEEERRAERDEVRRLDAIRMALLTANPAIARGVLPEYFDPEVEEDDDVSDVSLNRPDTNYDLSGVTWQSPQDMSESEMEAIQRLLGDSSITVPGSPAPAEGVTEQVDHLMIPTDPEWI